MLITFRSELLSDCINAIRFHYEDRVFYVASTCSCYRIIQMLRSSGKLCFQISPTWKRCAPMCDFSHRRLHSSRLLITWKESWLHTLSSHFLQYTWSRYGCWRLDMPFCLSCDSSFQSLFIQSNVTHYACRLASRTHRATHSDSSSPSFLWAKIWSVRFPSRLYVISL